MMKTYQATFCAGSALTDLPSAQTIFGAICQILADTEGEAPLAEYLDSFQDQPLMVHSSLFPEDLFPMPKRSIFSLAFVNESVHSSNPRNKLQAMAGYKKYKKIRYVSRKILENYILPNRFEQLQKDLLANPERFTLLESGILRLSSETSDYRQKTVLQTRNGSRGTTTEKDLFYTKTIYPDPAQKFSLYIKSDWPRERIEDLLMKLEIFGLGSRRTVGMNVFTLLGLKEIRLQTTGELQYLLSDCVPDEAVDLDRSCYGLQSAVFRGSKSYNGGYFTGRYTYLTPGSLINSVNRKGWTGMLVRDESQGKTVWHYGMGFVF
ncbi:type III-A CRISPR-associated RAMP protein Csm4 [Faecalibaculum rodentium]|uniref:type III-A CRISPR-associated RAMP protein Csm4 n=1 Tax=Faecalibaculum rodentium TaxID=1702221 RepID=UPI0023F53E5E|nr:hypothetical protein [Faecalibaculum rodentium]